MAQEHKANADRGEHEGCHPRPAPDMDKGDAHLGGPGQLKKGPMAKQDHEDSGRRQQSPFLTVVRILQG